MEERSMSAFGRAIGWEESRWRMWLERGVEGGSEEAAAASPHVRGMGGVDMEERE
jgi:hypothetical protein